MPKILNSPNIKYFYYFIHFLLLLFTFYIVEYLLFNNIGHRVSLKFWRFASISHFFGAIIFVSPFFLIKRKNFLLISLFLFSFISLGSVLYFRTYQQLIPLESFLYLSNFDGLSGSILSSFKLLDLLFIIPFILLLGINRLFKHKYQDFAISSRILIFICYFIVSILFFKLFWNKDFSRVFYRTGKSSPFYYDQFYTAKYYGVLPLWWWQINNSATITLSEESIRHYKKLLINSDFTPPQSLKVADSQPNIIFIMVESLDSWTLGFKYNGKEVTPYLNYLLKKPNVLFAPYIKSQTIGGRSSDSQLIINTGLLPLKVGAASFKSFNNEFLSFPKALQYRGYNSAMFCGGAKSFWNYYPFAKAQGFNRVISIDDYAYNRDDIFGFGLKDCIFFEQTYAMLEELEHPFYAQLITLSSHAPFVLKDDMTATNFCDDNNMCYYLHSINYVDRTLESFIKKINDNPYLKESVIIITGDHNGNSGTIVRDFLNEKDNTITQFTENLGTIPLIIVNSPITGWYMDDYNQIDIYTTLLDLFSVDYYWYGFGKSFIDNPANNIDFNMFYDRISYQDKYNISDSLIRGNFFIQLDL